VPITNSLDNDDFSGLFKQVIHSVRVCVARSGLHPCGYSYFDYHKEAPYLMAC
jgi:hypothetical protein